jgi:hypothetical protein
MRSDLVVDALSMAIARRRPEAGLIHHPDQGSKFVSLAFGRACGKASIARSIMPAGRVIGFLHADYRFTRREVDTVDRDVLWAFAEGFGHAFERAVLRERLQAQRSEIRRMMRATEEIIDDLCNAEIQLSAVTESESVAVARTGTSIFVAPQSRLGSLLTKREVEVLSLMSDGSTNAAIANELVISEGTVKSHVCTSCTSCGRPTEPRPCRATCASPSAKSGESGRSGLGRAVAEVVSRERRAMAKPSRPPPSSLPPERFKPGSSRALPGSEARARRGSRPARSGERAWARRS